MLFKVLMMVLACGLVLGNTKRPLTKSDRKFIKEFIDKWDVPVREFIDGSATETAKKIKYKFKYTTEIEDSWCSGKLEVNKMPDGSKKVNQDVTELQCVA